MAGGYSGRTTVVDNESQFLNEEDLSYSIPWFRLLLAVVLFCILCLQVLVSIQTIGRLRHSSVLFGIHDTIAGLHCRKPKGISHTTWRHLLTEMTYPTGNAIHALSTPRLEALRKALEQMSTAPVTLDTPRQWLELMKEHAPEHSRYIDMRIESVGFSLKE